MWRKCARNSKIRDITSTRERKFVMEPAGALSLKSHRRRVWARKPFVRELLSERRPAKEGPYIKVERSP